LVRQQSKSSRLYGRVRSCIFKYPFFIFIIIVRLFYFYFLIAKNGTNNAYNWSSIERSIIRFLRSFFLHLLLRSNASTTSVRKNPFFICFFCSLPVFFSCSFPFFLFSFSTYSFFIVHSISSRKFSWLLDGNFVPLLLMTIPIRLVVGGRGIVTCHPCQFTLLDLVVFDR